MVAILIFYFIELGGANMKKKIIEPEQLAFAHSEANERRYQQKLEVNQKMLQTFFNSFSQCFNIPYYPYDCAAFPETDPFVNRPEDIVNKKFKKKKK
jgi:hypothetical protein